VKAALLDINILTALLWPTHEHHDVAHHWFAGRGRAAWATCSLTQLGFVRIASNPAFSRDALLPTEALALLGQNLAHPAHEFWADTLQVPTAVARMEARLQGYRQLTDAYLLALAHRRKGVLATFDRGLRTLAGDEFSGSVEIVPIRNA
jgi:toxin-antitoxin system PIN domain toxin